MKFFIRNILFAVLLVPVHVYAQGNWAKLNAPTDKLLRYVFFTDSVTGWAAGGDGIIIHTTNGGTSWSVQNSTVTTPLVGLFFLNENTGWTLTWTNTPPFRTIIIKTTNGGSDWIAEDFPEPNIFMRAIYFSDEMNGWIGGTKIMGTTDGGTTWFDANIDSNFVSGLPVFSFNFYNRQYGYACGGFQDVAGVIWRTTNSGAEWTATGIAPDPIHELYFIDSLNVIGLSGDPEGFFSIGRVKTTDGGNNWSFDDIGIFGVVSAIDFNTRWEGWAPAGEKLLFTTNGGDDWSQRVIPGSVSVFDLTFPQPRYGYAVGDSGTVLKYIPLITDVETENALPVSFKLYQNYPNPFNPSTKIKYAIGKKQYASLKVYDSLGREVAALVNKELPPGEYEVEFNVGATRRGNLTSGIYFYQLKVGSFIQTKKMVILK